MVAGARPEIFTIANRLELVKDGSSGPGVKGQQSGVKNQESGVRDQGSEGSETGNFGPDLLLLTLTPGYLPFDSFLA
jgi:hypothetical protein